MGDRAGRPLGLDRRQTVAAQVIKARRTRRCSGHRGRDGFPDFQRTRAPGAAELSRSAAEKTPEAAVPVDAHIFATADQPVAEPVVGALAGDLAEAVGPTRFAHHYDGAGVVQRVPPGGYDLLPDDLPRAACVLRVRLESAYYGPGYERGYWPEVAAVLEFLRRRLPGGRVWYGRDDSDWVREVTAESLDALWAHWAEHGGKPYYKR